MSSVQRVKNVLISLFLFFLAFVLVVAPREAYDLVYYIIGFMMLAYGLRLLWFYFTMSLYMVGGKITLYQAIIVLDAALFTMTIAKMADYIVLIYLLGIFAFSGAIDILRAFEAKKNASPIWKKKIVIGIVEAGFAIVLVIVAIILRHTEVLVFGIILRSTDVLVYGFAVSLVSTGILKIYDAFRRTAIVYIQ